MTPRSGFVPALLAMVVLSSCASAPVQAPQPVDAFTSALQPLCGRAFGGRIVADTPAPTGEDPFAGKALVVHVRDCESDVWRLPFHVGDDRSRTWILTRTADGLRLKHQHLHQDGSPDVTSNYGGDSASAGTAVRQEFPVDAESKALFEREGRAVSMTNVWAIELQPGKALVYELRRPGRLFRVEFDLTRDLPLPPPAWGHAR